MFGLLLALAGCDGGNLFGGDGSAIGAPEVEIVSISPADTIDDGGILDLRVRAVSDRRVARVDIRLRQAVQYDTTIVVESATADATVDVSMKLPSPARDTLLVITVTAVDQANSVSEAAVDTLFVRDVTEPTAAVVVEPQDPSGGDTIQVVVTARDNMGVGALGFLVLDAEGDTISFELAPVAGSIADSVTRVFAYVVPDTVPPMTATVVAWAQDLRGLTPETPGVTTITIVDRTPPRVTIVRPASETTQPLGDSIFVQTELFDASGVVSASLVGLAFRGDPTLGTDETVVRYSEKRVAFGTAVRDTVLQRYLIPTSDKTSEIVSIIVSATDAVGNVGTDTVEVSVGGPRVLIESPDDGGVIQAGLSVGVRIAASDPTLIATVQLEYTGVVSDTVDFTFSPMPDSVVVDTAIAIPAGVSGTLRLVASARNAFGVLGRGEPVELTVQDAAVPDAERPTVSFTVSSRDRLEVGDSIRVRVRARDNNGGSGLSRIGFTARAINSARPDTLTQSAVVTFGLPRSGETLVEFPFVPFNVDSLALPDTLTFLIHAFAVDDAGNCSAAVSDSPQALDCVVLDGDTVAAGSTGESVDAVVVTGRTVLLPNGGEIGDVAIEMDTANAQYRLYLSNMRSSLVEVLDLADSTFDAPIRVGSQPWGLFVHPSADTLFVANSGGENISIVQLGATPAELTAERVYTPEAVLYEIKYEEDTIGRIKYSVQFYGFSDRLQYIVQDSTGRLLYSTEPTGAAPDGTIRVVNRNPDPTTTLDQPEIRILFDASEAINPVEGVIAVANIDSAVVYPDPEGNDILEFWDHRPGFPNMTVSASLAEGLSIPEALDSLKARSGDPTIVAKPGTWVLSKVGMSDTTFISASGDRGWVVFGEGATSPTGRVILWDAQRADVSDEVPVQDLIHNASDRVLGVGLNQNGTVGVLRGANAAYIFDQTLSLLGLIEGNLGDAGAGAALHWAHASRSQNDEAAVAFVPSSEKTIKIVHTLHFDNVNEIHIRDNIVGPLRIAPPLPTDNGGTGASCVGMDCVVAKLFGVTSAGGVVMVDVRRRDLQDVLP
ncbi:MAG TPA: hypothetical protein VF158_12530 [Longimicrobiales bacterium]